jgi:predicted Zn finger-like uncharacterized protein
MGFLDMRAEIGNLERGFAWASDSRLMILTCPECATGYFVEDGQIRATGRAVRCAACSHRWTAYPERPLELVTSDEEGAVAKEAPAPGPEAAPLTGDDLPRVFRGRVEEEKRLRKAALNGVVYAVAGLAVVVVIGLAIVFREGVVRGWPQTASLYAAIGLPVNITGLVIEQVHAETVLQDGHAAFAVSGVIRNITDRAVDSLPLKITVYNAENKPVAGQIAVLSNKRVPPGETRHFVTMILDPPASYAGLQVEFLLGAAPNIAHATATVGPTPTPGSGTPGFSLRGPSDATPDSNAASNAPAANTLTVPPPAPASAPAPTNAAAPQ